MKKVVVVNQTTCPLCGYAYAPDGSRACEHCPLQPGCTMICCPQCGHTTVDQESSSLVRGAERLFSFIGSKLGRKQDANKQAVPSSENPTVPATKISGESPNLGQAPTGHSAIITKFRAEMPLNRRQALISYGVEPGKCVHVLQQTPLTVFRVAQVELALERELASLIAVEVLPDSSQCPKRNRS